MDIKITAPGEKLLIRLWDTVEKVGIGAVAPIQDKRKARSEAESLRIRKLAARKLEQDIQALEAGEATLDKDLNVIPLPKTEGALQIEDHSDTDKAIPIDLTDKTASAMAIRGLIEPIKRQATVEDIAQRAAEILIEKQEAPQQDSEVDKDWIAKWRVNAELASSDELKGLWAQLLAGEVQQPGTFSFRTLEFLRGISTDEAKLIEKIGPLLLDKRWVFRPAQINDGNPLLDFGVTFDEMLDLESIGILNTRNVTARISTDEQDGVHLAAIELQGCKLMVSKGAAGLKKNTSLELDLQAYSLSATASEILSLGSYNAPTAYIDSIEQHAKKYAFDCIRIERESS